jgi:hypothetical protein
MNYLYFKLQADQAAVNAHPNAVRPEYTKHRGPDNFKMICEKLRLSQNPLWVRIFQEYCKEDWVPEKKIKDFIDRMVTILSEESFSRTVVEKGVVDLFKHFIVNKLGFAIPDPTDKERKLINGFFVLTPGPKSRAFCWYKVDQAWQQINTIRTEKRKFPVYDEFVHIPEEGFQEYITRTISGEDLIDESIVPLQAAMAGLYAITGNSNKVFYVTAPRLKEIIPQLRKIIAESINGYEQFGRDILKKQPEFPQDIAWLQGQLNADDQKFWSQLLGVLSKDLVSDLQHRGEFHYLETNNFFDAVAVLSKYYQVLVSQAAQQAIDEKQLLNVVKMEGGALLKEAKPVNVREYFRRVDNRYKEKPDMAKLFKEAFDTQWCFSAKRGVFPPILKIGSEAVEKTVVLKKVPQIKKILADFFVNPEEESLVFRPDAEKNIYKTQFSRNKLIHEQARRLLLNILHEPRCWFFPRHLLVQGIANRLGKFSDYLYQRIYYRMLSALEGENVLEFSSETAYEEYLFGAIKESDSFLATILISDEYTKDVGSALKKVIISRRTKGALSQKSLSGMLDISLDVMADIALKNISKKTRRKIKWLSFIMGNPPSYRCIYLDERRKELKALEKAEKRRKKEAKNAMKYRQQRELKSTRIVMQEQEDRGDELAELAKNVPDDFVFHRDRPSLYDPNDRRR